MYKWEKGSVVKVVPELEFDPRFKDKVGVVQGVYKDKPVNRRVEVAFDNGPIPKDWKPCPFFKEWPRYSIYFFGMDELIPAKKNSSLKLTPLGEFVNIHSVVVPHFFWRAILHKSKELLDGADSGEADAETWKFFLQELAKGCLELVENDKFLCLLGEDEGISDE